MLTPRQKYEVCRVKSGTAYFPFTDSNQAYIRVSTRHGNIIVKWGDGVEQQFTTSKNVDATVTAPTNFSRNYSPNYTGDVQVVFKLGLGDVYSIYFDWSRLNSTPTNLTRSLNIQNIKTFFAQFPNLYSVNFDIYSYQQYTTVIKGDFSQLPDSVERVKFTSWEVKNNGVDQWLDLSNYSPDSKLKYFNFSKESFGVFTHVTLKVNGDLSKLPSSCSFFKIASGGTYAGSSITYTAGKVWASAFDTLSIPLILTTAELDSLLADMDGSIMTKIGAGVITIGGYRSPSSDAHVASLQAKGFTVNINSLQSFITDAVITDGTQISALNYLDSNLKSAGLLDKMVAIYPFIGANENSHKRNLLNSKDDNTAFRLIFNTATHSVNGITCNYANTNFNSTNAIADNISVGVYSRTNNVNTGSDIAASIGSANNRFILYARYTGDVSVFDCYNASNERILFSNSDSRGLFVLTRTANNVLKAYKNGILLGSNTNTRTNMFSGNIFISGFPGATYSYTSRNYAFAFIGRGLSDTDVSNLQTIIQQYQTILGRAI